MRTVSTLCAAALIALAVSCARPGAPEAGSSGDQRSTAAEFTSEEQKTVYAVGRTLTERTMARFDFTPAEQEAYVLGAREALAKAPPPFDVEEYYGKSFDLYDRRVAMRTEANKGKAAEYVAGAARESGAVQTESGLIYFEIEAGDGPSPEPMDWVVTHLKGTLIDGTVVQDTHSGDPELFPLRGVIACWREGFQMMKTGGKAKFVCPPDIAYGDRGFDPVPGGAAVIYEVELLEVRKE